MKSLLLFIALFLNSYGYCQSGNVEYVVKSIDFEPKLGEKYTDQIIDLKARGEKQKFTLEFNSNYSKFALVRSLHLEESTIESAKNKMASLRFGTINTYYFDREKNITLCQTDDSEVIRETDQNWNITSETKKIDSYNCYKATLDITYLARTGDSKTKTVIAWFAPILPYGFGPKGYNGLPGLILELQDQETTYLAEKIEFQKREKTIKMPKGKSIDSDEMTKISSKKLENFKLKR